MVVQKKVRTVPNSARIFTSAESLALLTDKEQKRNEVQEKERKRLKREREKEIREGRRKEKKTRR